MVLKNISNIGNGDLAVAMWTGICCAYALRSLPSLPSYVDYTKCINLEIMGSIDKERPLCRYKVVLMECELSTFSLCCDKEAHTLIVFPVDWVVILL